MPVVGLLAVGVRDLVEQGESELLLDTVSLPEEEQAEAYRKLFVQLIESETEKRLQMSLHARVEALRYSRYAAMECLLQGCIEVIVSNQPLLVA